ncbi:MAG: Na+/H+ antiporter NhaC family protein [bacterium]|nr:Na+/H+ antiporter NhaC family protein [bacterium]
MTARRALAAALLAVLVVAVVSWAADGEAPTVAEAAHRGWVSVIPPLLAIGLALVARQVVVALLAGLWVGATLVAGDPFQGFLRLGDRYLVGALADDSHAAILVFSTILGGMVGVLARSGATEGIVHWLSSRVSSRRGGMVSTAVMGTLIFFDDYANTLLVGSTMRPLTDKLRISREKLSYLVDSTAAPVATVAVISTWVGFEVGLIQDAMARLGDDAAAYTFFLRSIPFGYYPLLTLVFVYLLAVTGRDLGPMRQAEIRAHRLGQVLRPGAQPASDVGDLGVAESAADRPPAHPLLAGLPILTVILTTAFGLYFNGLQAAVEKGIASPTLREVLNNADSFAVLTWAALGGAVLAVVLVVATRRQALADAVEGWVSGAKAMMIAMVILVLAWSLSAVCESLGTADFLVETARQGLSARVLPALAFVLAAAVSFATGTSWGTMAILVPLIYPLGAELPVAAGLDAAVAERIHLAAVSAVLAGAVFGDHCSPISDTTILSSLATGADHVDHVKTQLPYALLVGSAAMAVGYLPVGWGLSPWISLAVGVVILVAVLVWRGRHMDREPAA